MQTEREKFLEGLQCRLIGKNPEEQDAEITLAKFVQDAEGFANELECKQEYVTQTNLYEMFVERNYSGRYDIFKLDRDEGLINLAIGIVMAEREQNTIDER